MHRCGRTRWPRAPLGRLRKFGWRMPALLLAAVVLLPRGQWYLNHSEGALVVPPNVVLRGAATALTAVYFPEQASRNLSSIGGVFTS